jgi:hypothetical protein
MEYMFTHDLKTVVFLMPFIMTPFMALLLILFNKLLESNITFAQLLFRLPINITDKVFTFYLFIFFWVIFDILTCLLLGQHVYTCPTFELAIYMNWITIHFLSDGSSEMNVTEAQPDVVIVSERTIRRVRPARWEHHGRDEARPAPDYFDEEAKETWRAWDIKGHRPGDPDVLFKRDNNEPIANPREYKGPFPNISLAYGLRGLVEAQLIYKPNSNTIYVKDIMDCMDPEQKRRLIINLGLRNLSQESSSFQRRFNNRILYDSIDKWDHIKRIGDRERS